MASIGSKLYVQGGACYDRKACVATAICPQLVPLLLLLLLMRGWSLPTSRHRFFNWHDCAGSTDGLGKRLYVFDTAGAASGSGEWERLPDCALRLRVAPAAAVLARAAALADPQCGTLGLYVLREGWGMPRKQISASNFGCKGALADPPACSHRPWAAQGQRCALERRRRAVPHRRN